MNGLATVLENLEREDILVISTPLKENGAVCMERGRIIAFDPQKFETSVELRTVLIHESGHFESGAFYNSYSPYQIKEQAEYRAEQAAILRYIPYKEMVEQLINGMELWELAEYFDVTEEYCLKAYLFYKDKYGIIY